MFYAVLYEKGRRRNNQDSITLQRMKTGIGDVILAAVCDGLGGEERGEIASGYIAETLTGWFCDELPRFLLRSHWEKNTERSLSRLLFHAHEALRQYGLRNGIRCGTTAVFLLICGERYLAGQIGDSVICRLRSPFSCRTEGKAGVRFLAKSTDLVPRGESGRALEHCLGIGRYRPPNYQRGRIWRKDAFLLMSDGMQAGIDSDDLAGVLSPVRMKDPGMAERGLKTLADAVIRRGGTDNMSAIYLR